MNFGRAFKLDAIAGLTTLFDASSSFAEPGRPISWKAGAGGAGPAVPVTDFQVNEITTGEQRAPDVAVGPNGEFVAVWLSIDNGDQGIQMRRFDSLGAAIDEELRVSEHGVGGGPA